MVKVASVRSRRSSAQDQRVGLCQKDPKAVLLQATAPKGRAGEKPHVPGRLAQG